MYNGCVNKSRLLEDLAPTFFGQGDDTMFARMRRACFSASALEIAYAQLEPLEPIFRALQSIDASYPDRVYGGREDISLSVENFGRIYQQTAGYFGLVQTMRPVLCPMSVINSSCAQKKFADPLTGAEPINGKQVVYAAPYRVRLGGHLDFSGADASHRRFSEFGFFILDVGDAHSDVVERIAAPLIAIDNDIMTALSSTAVGPALLEKYKDIFFPTNHDYVHGLTGSVIKQYVRRDTEGYARHRENRASHIFGGVVNRTVPMPGERSLDITGLRDSMTEIFFNTLFPGERRQDAFNLSSDGNNYEFMANMLQAIVMQELEGSPLEQTLFDDIDAFFDLLKGAHAEIGKDDPALEEETFDYFSQLALHTMIRAYAPDHDIYRTCEARIAQASGSVSKAEFIADKVKDMTQDGLRELHGQTYDEGRALTIPVFRKLLSQTSRDWALYEWRTGDTIQPTA